jgi:hypothetical protein
MIMRDRYQMRTFDAMTLRRYYIKFKVKYIRPNYTYWKSFAEKNRSSRSRWCSCSSWESSSMAGTPKPLLKRKKFSLITYNPFMRNYPTD